MPEIADVVASETAASEWANDIRDRTVQRYADLAERAADHSSPTNGDLSYVASTGDLDIYHSGAWRHLNGPPVGTIIDHAGGSVPPGWLVCDGSAVSRTTYAGLFAQIGTAWGSGDGSTTFNLPDLRERVTRGKADSGTGSTVGQVFGADTHIHTMGTHVHSEGSHNHDIGPHGHTGISMAGASVTAIGREGTGSTFEYATKTHEHPPTATGSDDIGSTGSTNLGNTGATDPGDTNSGSTIQKSAAVNKLIRT